MKNREKFADAILDIAERGHSVGLLNGKPFDCECIKDCDNCGFPKSDCDEFRIKWFDEEFETGVTKADAKASYQLGYKKAVDMFLEESLKLFDEFDLNHGYPAIGDCEIILRDVAEKLNICNCADTSCINCDFGNAIKCKKNIKEWAEQEYVEEQEVDWSKVPVDTPILVSHDGENWFHRHFARYENGNVLAWYGGNTSWSNDKTWGFQTMDFEYAKLAGTTKKTD